MRPYSPNRFSHWDDCQFSWAAHYKDKIKQKDVSVMMGGGLFHRLAHKYDQHLLDTDQPTDIEMIEPLIKKHCGTEPLDVIDEYSDIFRYWAPTQNIQDRNNIYLEQRLAVDENFNSIMITDDKSWDSKDVFCRGIIDRLDIRDIPVIKDYKTNHVIPSDDELENSLQTRIYPMLVAKEFNITTEIRVIYEFVRYGVQKEFTVYPEQYQNITEWIQKKAAEIEAAREYEATFCSRCEYCPVRDGCPAMKRALDVEDIIMPTNEFEAIALGETFIALREKGKAVESLLKIYLQNHGSIPVGDQEYRQSVSNSYEFNNVENLVNVLISKGISKPDVWGMLGCTKTNFEKVMKRLKLKDMIDEVIDELGTPKISTMTKFYKVKK